MKTSQDFSKTINKSIVFDYVHKGILIGGMLLLAWFYRSNLTMLIALFTVIGLSVWFIYKEFGIQQKLNAIGDYSKELKEVIKMKLAFYKDHFSSLRFMLAFTNGLFVWVGTMFYLYSKYGYYMVDEIDDKIVNILVVSLSFGMSYLAISWLLKPKVMELEESLENIDDNQAATLQIKLREKQKRRQKILMIIFAIAGTLLLAFLTITYLVQIF